ncbi:MAG: FAD-dependent oxidoreductase [Lachnospiraceae bacterium]|jgi:thioredoxin reductase (NADPH)|nr:FAD-dependent oxidoreductase [Lachnospiraceae bacterium]
MADYDLVIIGSGPAGMTAAVYGVRANLSVLMLDRLAPGGQMINTSEIQNYTGMGTVEGTVLALRMFEHTRELGVEFDYRTVLEIRDQGETKTVLCEEEGCIYTARTVLISVGTSPRLLKAPKEERFAGRGISWCAVCDGAGCRDKDVAVIGGGNSAVEEAIYLAGFAKSVTVVVRSRLSADKRACQRLLDMEQVKLYAGWDVAEFCGEHELTGVRIRARETKEELIIPCERVFEYIGQIPATECFLELGILDEKGYVKVNERMETAVPGVFGAGDCVAKELRQVITACGDGAVAAMSAARYIRRYW